jgi:hypothetical protein
MLVDFGADAGQEDYEGLTPYNMAVQQRAQDFLRLFDEAGTGKSDAAGMGGCWFFNFFCSAPEPTLLPARDPRELPDIN